MYFYCFIKIMGLCCITEVEVLGVMAVAFNVNSAVFAWECCWCLSLCGNEISKLLMLVFCEWLWHRQHLSCDENTTVLCALSTQWYQQLFTTQLLCVHYLHSGINSSSQHNCSVCIIYTVISTALHNTTVLCALSAQWYQQLFTTQLFCVLCCFSCLRLVFLSVFYQLSVIMTLCMCDSEFLYCIVFCLLNSNILVHQQLIQTHLMWLWQQHVTIELSVQVCCYGDNEFSRFCSIPR